MNQDIVTPNIRQIGAGPIQIVFAHGWGHDGQAFLPVAQSFGAMATCYLPDFPGFGQTPPPPEAWGTREYADFMAAWLKTLPPTPLRIWVGHSFGCRVGLQLAAHHPDVFNKMVLVAAAGLKRRRTMFQKISHASKVYTFKSLKHFVPEGPKRDALRAHFGSADYRTSGVLRGCFVKVVNEDLSPEAESITCPTLIICGEKDTETPPELSHRLHDKIKNSALHILEGFDHYSILGNGRHQVAALIKKVMET